MPNNQVIPIAALRPDSPVTIFGEPLPLECIVQSRPDVLVKGSECQEPDIVHVPMVEGKSTSLKNCCDTDSLPFAAARGPIRGAKELL